jgi:hypothetical protein
MATTVRTAFRSPIVWMLLGILILSNSLLGQSSTVSLQVAGIDPEDTQVLPLNRTLYLKVHYVSDQPLRLQATGRFQGADIREIMNPSPVYPAGTGEGLVWISFRSPREIDEVLVTASDERWKMVQTLSVPVSVEWRSEAPNPPQAPWVQKMSDAQQEEVIQSMRQAGEESGPLDGILFLMMSVSVFGYPILQIYSLWKDGWKSLSAIPLIIMIPLLAYTAFAFAMQSNLWPLLFLFASPFAFLYLVLIRLFFLSKKFMSS